MEQSKWVVLYNYKKELFKSIIEAESWQKAVDNFFDYAKEHEICFSGKIKCVKADDYFSRLIIVDWCKRNILEEIRQYKNKINYTVEYFNGFLNVVDTIEAVSPLHAILEVFMQHCQDLSANPEDFSLLGCKFKKSKKMYSVTDEYKAIVDVDIKNIIYKAQAETKGL